MTQLWEPGTSYGYGDVVEYEGHRYKIIQPHRSQGDWTPPVTPALWGRMQDEPHGGGHHGNQYQQQQPQQHQGSQGGYQQPPQQPQQQYQPSDSNVGKNEEKHWYEDKKTIGIGGGILAGAAAIGAGIFAHHEYEKHKDEKNNQAWAQQTWLEEARNRTERYYRQGTTGPVEWVLAQGTNIPRDAIQTGEDSRHGWRMYSCRAFYDGGIAMGKASDVFKKGGVLGYCNDEIHVDEYEILVGDMRALRWVQWHGKLNVSSLGARPVEGGRENDGTPLYIARVHYRDANTPGKCSEKLDGAYIPYDGDEECIKDYQVLCYA